LEFKNDKNVTVDAHSNFQCVRAIDAFRIYIYMESIGIHISFKLTQSTLIELSDQGHLEFDRKRSVFYQK